MILYDLQLKYTVCPLEVKFRGNAYDILQSIYGVVQNELFRTLRV